MKTDAGGEYDKPWRTSCRFLGYVHDLYNKNVIYLVVIFLLPMQVPCVLSLSHCPPACLRIAFAFAGLLSGADRATHDIDNFRKTSGIHFSSPRAECF
jgi:hypothetical protein